MNKIKFTAATVAVAMLGGTAWFYSRAEGKQPAAYRTAPITRATLKSTVSATGTLNAVQTVHVGTQVSGQVAKVYVDFNDKVRKGQLLASIDPTLQQQAVQDAQAQLERAQATLTQAQDDYTRNKQLFDAKVITAQEFSTTQSNFAVQQASVKSAQIALDRARQNLSYTDIYAPIDGVIVERDVDVGQTVAASLSAPQLFLIANDLSEMEILASVDESDIGQIKNGQPVSFTVQSYPNQQFTGTVKQVRLQSTTTDNVVNYTAVISVSNATGKLLPGMTATVQFVTGSADSVLTVPSAALRVKATPEMLAESGTGADSTVHRDSTQRAQWQQQRAAQGAQQGGQQGGQGAGARAAGQSGTHSATGRPAAATIWTVDAQGKAHPVRVMTGMTDGQRTEIKGKSLTEGMQVITNIGDAATTTAAAPAQAASNPFQPSRAPMGAAAGGRGR
jgi:HlyD family secretion protein